MVDNFTIKLTADLKQSVNILHQMDASIYSYNVKKCFIDAIYIQLAEKGLLHILFPINHDSFEKQMCTLLSIEPAYNHNINSTCHHFGVSRSTLIRRLNKKNITFKFLLRKIRMNHAIYLMQHGVISVENLYLECGYHSSYRFQQYFKDQFGLTLKQYRSTLGMKNV